MIAQITSTGPYGWFDYDWRSRLESAAQIFTAIQDCWLTSDSPFPVERTVANILHISAFDFRATGYIRCRLITPTELQQRSIDDWFTVVKSPIEECGHCLPRIAPEEYEAVVQPLHDVLLDAANFWEPDTVSPLCEDVIRGCLDYLSANRFVTINK